MKKILVTGASGFIGFHACSHFLEQGYEVLAIDNFNDYYNPALKFARSKILHTKYGLNVVNLDISDFSVLGKFFEKNEVDSVIHLAAQAGIRIKTEHNYKYSESNLQGFSNIASLAVVNKISNFTYASSSSVYGNNTPSPYKEDSSAIKPLSFYGATKLSNEILASTLAESGSTTFTGLRFFTAYGEWGRPDMAYFRIAEALINKKKFQLFGDGMVRRDFTYIADIIQGVARIHNLREFNSESPSEIFNIGGGTPHSMIELFEMFEKLTGKTLEIDYLPSVKADVNLTFADTNKLFNATKFVPQVTLEEGVSNFLAWCMSANAKDHLDSWINS
jgi:UDP-glucuronate 4-epimerase